MTTWQSYQGRDATDVPWDKERERRVLGRALRAFRHRTRRNRALELAAALAAILVVGRALPRAPSVGDEARRMPAVPAATLETPARDAAVALPSAAVGRAKGGPSGGFAGTGGHGGSGSTGSGGSAGTG